jgi:5-methylcytosine-specific restriction endonuclease McrA
MKICPFCSKEVIKRNNKYCNSICQISHVKKIIHEKIENGDTTLYEKTYKNYLISKFGNKCMECGWDKVHPITNKVPIQLEHIDGDSTNNSIENLKLLCPNCHSLTPTYGALNKGNGRKNRKR